MKNYLKSLFAIRKEPFRFLIFISCIIAANLIIGKGFVALYPALGSDYWFRVSLNNSAIETSFAFIGIEDTITFFTLGHLFRYYYIAIALVIALYISSFRTLLADIFGNLASILVAVGSLIAVLHLILFGHSGAKGFMENPLLSALIFLLTVPPLMYLSLLFTGMILLYDGNESSVVLVKTRVRRYALEFFVFLAIFTITRKLFSERIFLQAFAEAKGPVGNEDAVLWVLSVRTGILFLLAFAILQHVVRRFLNIPLRPVYFRSLIYGILSEFFFLTFFHVVINFIVQILPEKPGIFLSILLMILIYLPMVVCTAFSIKIIANIMIDREFQLKPVAEK